MIWMHSKIRLQKPNRPSLHTVTDNRACSRYYFLPDNTGEDQCVCQAFFLHTLGYKSDKIVKCIFKKNQDPGLISTPYDQRGKHAPHNKLPDDSVKLIHDHVNSYHPAVSHYRREHAPNRRYLPPELSLKEMYEDFNAKHPNICKKERYRKVLKSMNISFGKLGEEECEVCTAHKAHMENQQHVDEDMNNCSACTEMSHHLEKSRIVRHKYTYDKERSLDDDEVVVSVDMQKIIMLPRMPGIKSCVFTRRLVQFHETFAPLGGKKRRGEAAIGVLWNESMSGRNAEDLASTFTKFLRHPSVRDKKRVIMYLDNCSAQNKNWTVFTAMINEVNRPGGLEQIIFRYFEKGHTFMSADSFHHLIEKGMRDRKNIYDGEDFKAVVNEVGVAVEMQVEDFIMFENGVSQGKYTHKPLLADVQEVMFKEGSTNLFWKDTVDDDEYQEGAFLKKKLEAKISDQRQETFAVKNAPRGVSDRKKNDIVTKLCKFMPKNRHNFWINLSSSTNSSDLIDEY